MFPGRFYCLQRVILSCYMNTSFDLHIIFFVSIFTLDGIVPLSNRDWASENFVNKFSIQDKLGMILKYHKNFYTF